MNAIHNIQPSEPDRFYLQYFSQQERPWLFVRRDWQNMKGAAEIGLVVSTPDEAWMYNRGRC